MKESSQEIAALNSLLNKMREEEVNQTAKHKDQLEKTRKLAQERVATAQAAVAAAQKSTEQLQEKAAMQLKDANNKVHQAEAKLLAVCLCVWPPLTKSVVFRQPAVQKYFFCTTKAQDCRNRA